jgi:REP element-mobilizing transposase RayT
MTFNAKFLFIWGLQLATGDKAKYNPVIHHRRSIRLQGYDYSRPGAYFVTICLQEKDSHLLGEVVTGKVQGSRYGEIVLKCWNRLPRHYPNVILDEFVVMPNHVHGIILIGAGAKIVGAGLQNRIFKDVKPARTGHDIDDMHDFHHIHDMNEVHGENIMVAGNDGCAGAGLQNSIVKDEKPARTMDDRCIVAYSLSEIIRGFKTFSARRINEFRGISGVPVWQRNYWKHIVRDEGELQRIREYINNNPLRWEKDKLDSAGGK